MVENRQKDATRTVCCEAERKQLEQCEDVVDGASFGGGGWVRALFPLSPIGLTGPVAQGHPSGEPG